MLCPKVLALIFSAILLTNADLLDLYVQHMDEVMRDDTLPKLSNNPSVPKHLHKRLRRSVVESPLFRVSNPAKQSLDAPENSARRSRLGNSKFNRKFRLETDALEFPHLHQFNERHDTEDKEPQTIKPKIEKKTVNKLDLKKESKKDEYSSTMYKSFNKKRHPPKKYWSKKWKATKNYSARVKRHISLNSTERHSLLSNVKFIRREILDDRGDILLEWDPRDEEIVTFRVTAKTLGYVGIGFNEKSHMKGADIILAWIDDHNGAINLVDSHGLENSNGAPETDASQDLRAIQGSQNDTHTIITFSRRWQTCDPYDRNLSGDTVRVIWALHPQDPEFNVASWHGDRRGGKALRLKAPPPHPTPAMDEPEVTKWDVKLNQYTVSNSSDTIYWCKIFQAPKFDKKHHMIGYQPLIEKSNEPIVHHIILYECASTQPILSAHSRLAGAHCYSPTMPKEWDSCLQPIVAWARGSVGEWMPKHVGLPVGEHSAGTYYMLEVHYNNFNYQAMKRDSDKPVVDSSGVRLHLTSRLRQHEAGILVAGVAVSPLHLVPPNQKEYATAGYCTSLCTDKMFPDEGINAVSVVLHAHLAGRRLGIKHIRNGIELDRIVQDNRFDFDYQQSHTLEKEVKILPGDELVTECVYDTRNRNRPTFGGYSANQEMCLAFIVHYPRTPLAACYSMTPVKKFFKALNVQKFRGVTMEQVETLFLSTTTESTTLPVSPNQQLYPDFEFDNQDLDDVDIIKEAKSVVKATGNYMDYDDIFARLVIEEPEEFKDHTLSDHMSALAWNDSVLSRSFEKSLYYGKHVTFCRKRDDKLPLPAEIRKLSNFTMLPDKNNSYCKEMRALYGSSSNEVNFSPILVFSLAILSNLFFKLY